MENGKQILCYKMEIIIKPSSNKNKKFDAIINNKTIPVGEAGASDFTKHINEDRKQRFS